MFLVMHGCASAVTVVPGGEDEMWVIMLTSLLLSILCGVSAVLLRWKFTRNTESVTFRSRVVLGICIAIAAVLTFCIVFGIIG
jgi:hypothetical protein